MFQSKLTRFSGACPPFTSLSKVLQMVEYNVSKIVLAIRTQKRREYFLDQPWRP
jgi:hypothetical protein